MEYFRLEVTLRDDVTVEDVSNIIGLHPTNRLNEDGVLWLHEVEVSESDQHSDPILDFCERVGKNMTALNSIGIQADDISIWLLYEYDQQCNMEFTPDEMRAMGDLGIAFCISCWAK